jgi:hypothetical protein
MRRACQCGCKASLEGRRKGTLWVDSSHRQRLAQGYRRRKRHDLTDQGTRIYFTPKEIDWLDAVAAAQLDDPEVAGPILDKLERARGRV